MQRLIDAVDFLLRRHVKVADPAVKQAGQAHILKLSELKVQLAEKVVAKSVPALVVKPTKVPETVLPKA